MSPGPDSFLPVVFLALPCAALSLGALYFFKSSARLRSPFDFARGLFLILPVALVLLWTTRPSLSTRSEADAFREIFGEPPRSVSGLRIDSSQQSDGRTTVLCFHASLSEYRRLREILLSKPGLARGELSDTRFAPPAGWPTPSPTAEVLHLLSRDDDTFTPVSMEDISLWYDSGAEIVFILHGTITGLNF